MPISPEQEALEAQRDAQEVHRYAVWGIIPDNVLSRIKKVMEGLREEFGGPEVEPHITMVGSCLMTEDEAINTFRGACNAIKQFYCKVENLETSKFYFQCVSLVIEISEDVSYFYMFTICFDLPIYTSSISFSLFEIRCKIMYNYFLFSVKVGNSSLCWVYGTPFP